MHLNTPIKCIVNSTGSEIHQKKKRKKNKTKQRQHTNRHINYPLPGQVYNYSLTNLLNKIELYFKKSYYYYYFELND